MSDAHKKIADALEVAAEAYKDLARENMTGDYGGEVYAVYYAMRDCVSLQNKARRIRQNFSQNSY